jgi:hypothetical protein
MATPSRDRYGEFAQLVYANFPTDPVPHEFFWSEGKLFVRDDISQEFRERFAGRRWPEITLMDWRMTGTRPTIAHRYLKPSTFRYYLPSLLLGVFDDLDFLDWALEAILPFNKWHVPRGKWWADFDAAMSESQRATLRSFLTIINPPAGSVDQHLLSTAKAIWDRDPDAA